MARRVALAALLAFAGRAQAEAGAAELAFAGYVKNLAAHSSTVAGAPQSYLLDLTRARLKLQGELAPGASLDLQYDHEVLLGNYLQTAEFALLKRQQGGQYWHAQQNYLDRRDIFARHRLYRASITLRHGNTDFRLGRQRIAWGTGRIWSPLDVLNPIAPAQLEREERPGVDALLAEHKLGALERASLVYVPHHEAGQASAALQYHGNRRGVDYSLAWGKFGGNHLLGGDLATQWGELGLRAEIAQLRPAGGARYRRLLLGLDYGFANTLTVSAEVFQNGQRGGTPRAIASPMLQFAGQRYAGGYAGYEVTPLWKVSLYAVRNLSDHSHYLGPGISWSVREDLEWALGMQRFGGRKDSEFGRLPHLVHTHLQWFF